MRFTAKCTTTTHTFFFHCQLDLAEEEEICKARWRKCKGGVPLVQAGRNWFTWQALQETEEQRKDQVWQYLFHPRDKAYLGWFCLYCTAVMDPPHENIRKRKPQEEEEEEEEETDLISSSDPPAEQRKRPKVCPLWSCQPLHTERTHPCADP